MGISTLVMLAFLGGAMLQFFLRRLPVAIVIPSAALSLWILFTELLQPYKGGGAFLEVLEGKTLPAFEILQKRAAG